MKAGKWSVGNRKKPWVSAGRGAPLVGSQCDASSKQAWGSSTCFRPLFLPSLPHLNPFCHYIIKKARTLNSCFWSLMSDMLSALRNHNCHSGKWLGRSQLSSLLWSLLATTRPAVAILPWWVGLSYLQPYPGCLAHRLSCSFFHPFLHLSLRGYS